MILGMQHASRLRLSSRIIRGKHSYNATMTALAPPRAPLSPAPPMPEGDGSATSRSTISSEGSSSPTRLYGSACTSPTTAPPQSPGGIRPQRSRHRGACRPISARKSNATTTRCRVMRTAQIEILIPTNRATWAYGEVHIFWGAISSSRCVRVRDLVHAGADRTESTPESSSRGRPSCFTR